MSAVASAALIALAKKYGPAVLREIVQTVLPGRAGRTVAGKLDERLIAAGIDLQRTTIAAQHDLIRGEQTSHSWLTRNWRPLLMMTFTSVIALRWIVAPLLDLIGFTLTVPEIPEQMWTLLTAGVSGYVVGRSAEKVAEVWGQTRRSQTEDRTDTPLQLPPPPLDPRDVPARYDPSPIPMTAYDARRAAAGRPVYAEPIG